MKTWGWFLWTWFFLWVVLIVKVLLDCVSAYRQSGCLEQYLVLIAAILGFTYWNTKRLGPEGYQLHLHHYVIACFMLTVVCYQSPFISFFYGFMNGMAVEGGCRWGFDPIWEKKEPESKATDEVTQQVWFWTETFRHTAAQRVKWILLKAAQSQTRIKNYEQDQSKAHIAHCSECLSSRPTFIQVTPPVAPVPAPAPYLTYQQPVQYAY